MPKKLFTENKKLTVYTHPILKGPFVFLSVPTPSFWDQLKLKNNARDGRILSASNRLGDTLFYDSPATFVEKFRKSRSMGSNTETTHE